MFFVKREEGGHSMSFTGRLRCATLLATMPVAIVFSWLQTYLVKGLALGAAK